MNKEKFVKNVKVVVKDAIAMIACVVAADLVCAQVDFLKNAQSLVSVAAGVWLWRPVKSQLDNSKHLQ